MIRILFLAILLFANPIFAEEIVKYSADPMRKIQSFVDREIGSASQEFTNAISKDSGNIVGCIASNLESDDPLGNVGASKITKAPTFWTQIDGEEYAMSTIETNNGKYCFYLLYPSDRFLSAEEGRTIAAALILSGTPSAMRSSAGIRHDPSVAEGKINDLFSAITSTKNMQRLNTEYGIAAIETIRGEGGDNWTSCTDLNSDSIEVKTSPGLKSGYIYNTVYSWKRIGRAGGDCFFLSDPTEKGLNQNESKLFDIATTYGVSPPDELEQLDFFHQPPQNNSEDTDQTNTEAGVMKPGSE